MLLQRNINIDVEFLSELEREEQTYLVTALKAHLSCLAMTSTHHLLTYRVVALWLNNSDKDQISKIVGAFLHCYHLILQYILLFSIFSCVFLCFAVRLLIMQICQ